MAGVVSVFAAGTLAIAQDCKVGTVQHLENPSQEIMKGFDCCQNHGAVTVCSYKDQPVSIGVLGKTIMVLKNENTKCEETIKRTIGKESYFVCLEGYHQILVTGTIGRPYYIDKTKALFEK